MTRGAFAVVINVDRSMVLLHQRRDLRVWSLPGGGIEPGETTQTAVIRETLEETGYEIEVERFVGEYLRPQVCPDSNANRQYLGFVIGGGPIDGGDETTKVAWFDPAKLPKRRTLLMKMYIDDALHHSGEPFRKVVVMPRWQRILRRFAFVLRDLRR